MKSRKEIERELRRLKYQRKKFDAIEWDLDDEDAANFLDGAINALKWVLKGKAKP